MTHLVTGASPHLHPSMFKNSSASRSQAPFNRRSFFKNLAGASAAAGGLGLAQPSEVSAVEVGPLTHRQRLAAAFGTRLHAAGAQMNTPRPARLINADDTLYPNFIGSFTKALPHNALGEVDPAAYQNLRRALASGSQSALAAVPLGGSVKLANPQAAYAYQLEGADSHHHVIPPAPALGSAWCAAEMTEVYWRAWTRDIPFAHYSADPSIAAAAADLSALSDLRAPKTAGLVTSQTLFRGPTSGDLTGPFISQFLYQDIPFGATTITQRYRTTLAGDNHMTRYADWLAVQNGSPAITAAAPDPTLRYIANGRDLAKYVHVDFSYQAFQGAALILLGHGSAALDDENPYKSISNQGAFITFGGPMILDLVARAAIEALKAAWYQKWLVHRRLRPEAYGGLVHHKMTGAAQYPVHADVLNSAVLPFLLGAYGTYLLPMAYPEGCPTHPAYPAGHATIAGACVTVLKAFFKESFLLPAPVESDADGLNLLPYAGALTVGDELNKLASNIALGRDMAGVHWRSDGVEGLKLGEEVAIRLLRDHKLLNPEKFAGFTFTRFDGSSIRL